MVSLRLPQRFRSQVPRGADLGMTSREEWRPTSQRGAPLEMWRKSEAVAVAERRRSGEGGQGGQTAQDMTSFCLG